MFRPMLGYRLITMMLLTDVPVRRLRVRPLRLSGRVAQLSAYQVNMMQMEKAVPDADFIFTDGPMAGQKIDFLWTLDDPLAIQKMNESFQKPKFLRKNEEQLISHLEKADIVPLDYRTLTPSNQEIVNQWLLKLEPSQRNRILIMKE